MGRNAEVWPGAVVLLARRRSRQPGCFASGESQGIIRRGKFTFPLGCSRAFLGQKPSTFSSPPARQAELVCFSQLRKIAYCGSRVLRTLVGVWGEQPQRSFCLIGISSLRTRLLIGKSPYLLFQKAGDFPICRAGCYIAPFLVTTTQTVRNRIFQSRIRDQFSMYSRSSCTTLSKSRILLRPLTCHKPVMPGLVDMRPRW